MGIAKKLTQLMREQDTNANELANKSGIPPTTIYSLIKRDSRRVDIDSLIKIARALGTSADYLCDDNNFSSFEHNSNFPTVHEMNILKKYRILDQSGKDTVDVVLDAQYSRCSSSNDDLTADEIKRIQEEYAIKNTPAKKII